MPKATPHTLRHTHASILLAENEQLTAVSKRLGHADPQITMRYYAHLLDEDDRSLATATARFLATDNSVVCTECV